MANPVPGYGITTPFGRRGHWAAGYHTGDDYAAPRGTSVVATRFGKVIHVGWGGWSRAYGAHIILDNGSGIHHMYAHLSRTYVRKGQVVQAGQLIGRVGSTGNSTGPHLHYEERHKDYGYYDHRKPKYNRLGTGAPTYLKKLKFGQKNSASVKNLQRALNVHPALSGKRLSISGYYGTRTDYWVRLCQKRHGYGNDPARESFVGKRQAKHLKLPKIRD